MKKIKFLNGFVLVLIVIYILQFLSNCYLIFFTDFIEPYEYLYEDFIFGFYTQFVSIAFSLLTFIGLLFIKFGLVKIIKEGFFNLKSATKFKTSGILFLTSGFLSFVFSTLLMCRSSNLTVLSFMGQDFLLMIIGFSLYVVADILQDGNLLKQENELTI